MKRILLMALTGLICVTASAQQLVKGTVKEKPADLPVAFATVTVGTTSMVCDAEGNFSIQVKNNTKLTIQVSGIGYRTVEIKQDDWMKGDHVIEMERINLFLQPIEVKALRADHNAPFSKTNIGKKEIEKLNTGLDIPFVLNQTPSVIVNSDAGNGIGYTGIRIRGTDATRINMTLNGIPYNDAESQGIFFVDLPDILSSTSSIQIQRGVGTSSNGAGAFGATLNLGTNEFNEEPYGEVNNSYGSFNTWKHSLKFGTGLINGKFTIDARISKITSDGFIDRGNSELRSFYVSAAYLREKTSVRFNLFSGKEKTYQAWNGIPEAKLFNDQTALLDHYYNNIGSLYFTTADSVNLFRSDPRKYNVFTYPNQTDNYQQDHYQFFVNHEFNKKISFNSALFLTRGKGYYEEYKYNQSFSDYNLPDVVIGGNTISETNLVRQLWLDNYFYGTVLSFQYKKDQTQLTFGGGTTKYDGHHFGEIIWAQYDVDKNYRWYDLTATKTDINLYAKLQQKIKEHFNLFADIQWRNVSHTINGFRKNPLVYVNRNFNFINPKIGISYSNKEWNAYLSYSLAGKEPNRDDFEASPDQQPKQEILHDIELSVEKKGQKYSWGATFYYMMYKDQLVLTGKINDVGAYTRTNIRDSYRMGVELQGTVNISSWLNANANLTLSENKIKNFNEYLDDYDNGGQKNNLYPKTDIALSPGIVGYAAINFLPLQNLEASVSAKYVGRQYLDNTSNDKRKIDAFLTNDLRFSYKLLKKVFRETNFFFQLNNIFNVKYQPSGYTYSYIYGNRTITENFYFPMAGINFMSGINIRM